jgi:hypothetical protein
MPLVNFVPLPLKPMSQNTASSDEEKWDMTTIFPASGKWSRRRPQSHDKRRVHFFYHE